MTSKSILFFMLVCLKELLGYDDNLVSIKTIDTFENLSSKPHKPERILDSKTKRLRCKYIREFN